MTPREALIQQYQVRFQQPEEDRLSEKPLACTQDCGGRLPDPLRKAPPKLRCSSNAGWELLASAQ